MLKEVSCCMGSLRRLNMIGGEDLAQGMLFDDYGATLGNPTAPSSLDTLVYMLSKPQEGVFVIHRHVFSSIGARWGRAVGGMDHSLGTGCA